MRNAMLGFQSAGKEAGKPQHVEFGKCAKSWARDDDGANPQNA